VLGQFTLLPLAVGDATVAEVAEVIERLWGGPETLIVISTDLSHYHSYEEARRIDARTLARIASYATDLDHEEACGATPLNGMLRVAGTRGLAIRQLAANNSGDTAGGKARVVGYSAFALEEPGNTISVAGAGRTLIAIARAAIARQLGLSGAAPAEAQPAWLGQSAATFVTLTKVGGLRGCIGSLQAARPLGEDVAANAIGAAFRDPRFPKLTAEEWPHCTVEVSLLSAAKKIRFGDEADLLAQIEPGLDGLILEHEGKRATYLPQVWESLPDKQRFLAELKQKAGIAPETPLRRCSVRRYRAVKWKEERPH
jgi:MEMO1 family protein